MNREVRDTQSTREMAADAAITAGLMSIVVMGTTAAEAGSKTADMVEIGGGRGQYIAPPSPTPHHYRQRHKFFHCSQRNRGSSYKMWKSGANT